MKREEMKKEAIKRMKMLGLYQSCIDDFEIEGIVNESEGAGMLYWLNENEKGLVNEFEQLFGGLVYHVIHSYTNIGEMYSFLYVSKYKEEWGMDRECLEERTPLVYVVNKTMPDCSEFGSISIVPANGGLIRTF